VNIPKKSIGTFSESSLHRSLKYHYAGFGGRTEVETEGYIADGINTEGEFIEIQTGSFAPLKAKIKEFTRHGKVRIIYPVAFSKYIEVFEPKLAKKRKKTAKPELLYRRKSPVKGTYWDLFDALMYAPELAFCPNVKIEVVLACVTEKRIRDGKGSWRRKGLSIVDRELDKWHESVVLEKRKDYLRFVPFNKKETFTVKELAARTGISEAAARKTLYVLAKINIVDRVGKKGNFWLYKVNLRRKNPRKTQN
jgi:hypothetical protein